MSTLYNLEPQPTAKAVLNTTAGEILLELFAQQTPLASRNFLQLCLDGYYDRTIFHRLVPGFVIQGGDPTGTGSGGESSYDAGKPFEDEFHSRLKFTRRGLLGMANTGVKNDNGSQFFLTLGKTDELQGRNTMFGRVVGDTIYNVVKMGEAELTDDDGSERPLYPTLINSTEILVNPFQDMVKRVKDVTRSIEDKTQAKKKSKKKAGKQMLSFGVDEEGEGAVEAPVQTAKFNPRLVAANQDPIPRPSRPSPPRAAEKSKRIHSPSPVREPVPQRPVRNQKQSSQSQSEDESSRSPSPELEKHATLLARTNANIENLKQSMKRANPTPTTQEPARKKTALEAMIPSTSTRGRKRNAAGASGERNEDNAMTQFAAFQQRLQGLGDQSSAKAGDSKEEKRRDDLNDRSANTAGGVQAEEEDDEAELCDLHFIINCESCQKWDSEQNKEEDDAFGSSLIGHKLSFAKDRLGKDLEWKRQNEKELVVIDPREKAKEIKAGKKQESKKR